MNPKKEVQQKAIEIRTLAEKLIKHGDELQDLTPYIPDSLDTSDTGMLDDVPRKLIQRLHKMEQSLCRIVQDLKDLNERNELNLYGEHQINKLDDLAEKLRRYVSNVQGGGTGND